MEDPLPIKKELLEILACPACYSELRLEQNELVCVGCQRRYQIDDGIPILLIEEEN